MFSKEHFSLHGWYIDYDGKTIKGVEMSVNVAKFDETKKIHELDVFPLAYHLEEPKIRKELIERGKRFHSFKGQHYCEYKGIALGVKILRIWLDPKQEMIRYHVSF